jgi:hypothetical protein
MADDLTQALARLAAWLEPRLRADAQLRDAVAGLAQAVAAWAGSLGPAEPAPQAVAPTPPAPAADARPPLPAGSLAQLRIEPITPPPTPAPLGDGDRDLDLLPLLVIADRCRVKGDAARLVARRLADPHGTPDLATEAEVLARAESLPDCNLWMLTREPVVTAPRAWEDLAGAFATAADSCGLMHAWAHAPAPLVDRHAPRVLSLAAEAQSVLLYAVADVRDVKLDFDQVQLFAHIRTAARDRQVFIAKYLKREDRADPGSWPDVGRRVAETLTQLRAVGDRDRARQKGLGNLRFKLTRLRDNPDANAGEWPRVLELVDDLVGGGLPPSNADLRDLLLPVLEDIPDELELSPNVTLVLREIDRYLETRPDADPPPRPPRPSPAVAEAAGLLRGREVVLIGGQARPLHKAALMRAFGLADVRWIVTPEHTSFTVFEPDVARPEVAVVLLAIRWSNHDYDGVRQYCEEYGKPLVRLPGGYNANQVAHHIMSQAGDRLRTAHVAAG